MASSIDDVALPSAPRRVAWIQEAYDAIAWDAV
jgi:hypothetical protein